MTREPIRGFHVDDLPVALRAFPDSASCSDCSDIGRHPTFTGGMVCDQHRGTRDRAALLIRAVVAGHTPEEITVFLSDGFPDMVVDAFSDELEADEMRAHADLLAETLIAAEQTTGRKAA